MIKDFTVLLFLYMQQQGKLWALKERKDYDTNDIFYYSQDDEVFVFLKGCRLPVCLLRYSCLYIILAPKKNLDIQIMS